MKILDVAKAALYGFFLNYYCYNVLTGGFIPGGTIMFFGAACLCVGVDVLQRRYIHMGREIRSWILYAVLALITSAAVLLPIGSMDYVSDIAKFVQRLMVIMMVAYICEREQSVKFGLRLMAVTAVALAVSVMMVTGDVQLKLDLTSGAVLSANDAGSIAAFGCFAVIFGWGSKGKSSLLRSALKTAGVVCCMIIIFLSGSRKSVYAVVIMLVMILLLCLRDYGSKINFRKLVIMAVVGTVAYLFISKNLLPYAEQTNLYARLFGRSVESTIESDDIRVDLYVWALEDFLAHPFFGLGFNQFTEHHGNYTHSTFVEPLACSGLVGLLYLYPYYTMVRKQLYLIRVSKKGSYARLKQKELLVYLSMALFIGIGIPFMYKDTPCILLGTIIASQAISFEELRKNGVISADY